MKMRTASVFKLGLAAAVLGAAGRASANLTIVPTFDSSITTSPSAAAMEAGINAAITQMESKILNPVTVNIQFVADSTVSLGQNNTFYDSPTYSTYRSDLMTKQTLSAHDNTAISTLPAGSNNPIGGGNLIDVSLPLLRALGEASLGSNGGGLDSTVSLNMTQMNFLRTGTLSTAKYDLESVALHEITEVLGAGGFGSNLNFASSSTDLGPLDLFRYSAAGVRSYTTSSTATAYFSIDGGNTNLSYFNQDGSGDYGDWDGNRNPTRQVQDAFALPNQQLNLDATELTALDVVGWNVVQTPEPASAALLSLGALGLLRKRR